MIEFLLIFFGTSTAFCLYMLIRNECVYHYRIKMIDRDMGEYMKLPSYEHMMRRFWVWPLSKFEDRK